MRAPWLPLLLLVASMLPVADAQATPDVRIVELLPSPASGDREFIELWNAGDMAVDLAGWVMRDNNRNFTLPSWQVPPGGLVVLWSGPGNATGGAALGPSIYSQTIWNTDGDEATLFAPDGTVVDQIAYGIGAALPKPPTNRSLTLQGSQWVQAAPTPGYAESPTGGTLDATVQDVPPEVSLGDVPTRVRTGTVFPVTFTVAEPNGDPVTWRIEDNTGVLAQGTGTGSKSADLVAPDTPRAWPIALVASDGTQETRIAFSVQVALSDLDVQVPAGGVAFPPLVPGSADVDALSDITIRNLGSSPLTLLVDVSDFTGSGNATIPVAGALRVGTVASDGTITWTEYMGPLTELPALPAGAEVGLRFRVATVPVPLPAGDYTTSFTVTAP